MQVAIVPSLSASGQVELSSAKAYVQQQDVDHQMQLVFGQRLTCFQLLADLAVVIDNGEGKLQRLAGQALVSGQVALYVATLGTDPL